MAVVKYLAKLWRFLGAAITTLLLIAALVMAGWFIFAQAREATLITFQTGSMSPTMPQGALAVTVPVTADELEIGDVITVQRAGESIPVTHRITEIDVVQARPANAPDIRAAAPGSGPPDLTSPHARQIEMQGDDNAQPDFLPYVLTDAAKVVFAVPYVGTVLMLVQSPPGMGLLIVLVGSLVVWAMWPKRRAQKTENTSKSDDSETVSLTP